MAEQKQIVVASQAGIFIGSGGDIAGALSAGFGSQGLILSETDLGPAFYDLRTGLAGELFQKVINYRVPVAIVLPDPSAHGQRFSELVYEHQSHNMVRVVSTEDDARSWLLTRES